MPSMSHRTRVTGEEIVDKTILEIDIGPAAVGFTELTAGLQGSLGGMPDSIGTTELKEPGVGSQNIYNGAVYGTKIANDAIGSRHIQGTAISYENQVKVNILGYGRLTAGLQGSLGGIPDTIGTTQLKEPGVGSQNIYSQAVYGAKIKNNAVGSQQLANAGVISTKIADHTIGSHHLYLGSNILSDPNQIPDAFITASHLGLNIIGSHNLADACVTETKFAEHLEHGTITAVALTGRYKAFNTAFYSMPHVVITPIGTYDACLAHDPDVGSFKVKVATNAGLSGTANLHYHAWGERAP